jgi:hypothetical protein
MSDTPAKPWGLPLTPEAKAEAIMRINHRHQLLMAVGPVAFAKMGRDDKDRYRAIQLLSRGYEVHIHDELAPD